MNVTILSTMPAQSTQAATERLAAATYRLASALAHLGRTQSATERRLADVLAQVARIRDAR